MLIFFIFFTLAIKLPNTKLDASQVPNITGCCGPSTPRNGDTAKSFGFDGSYDFSTTQPSYLGIIEAQSTITVLQFDFKLSMIYEMLTGYVPNLDCCSAPYPVCNIEYRLGVVLWKNGDNHQLSNQFYSGTPEVYYLTTPANDEDFFYIWSGILQTWDDKEYLEYSTFGDVFYHASFPEGIFMNNGDQIGMLLEATYNCPTQPSVTPALTWIGQMNFIYAYASSPEKIVKKSMFF